jgi:imidazolonepropionase-like amidohydrolase
MKKILFFVLSIMLLADCSDAPQTIGQTVFINVNVIPMDEERVLEDQTVVIEGDRIVDIISSEEFDIALGSTIIDGTGKYLIPGLAEMHGHVPPTNPGPNAPDYFDVEYVKNTLFLYISNGITTVRGMLGYEDQLSLKDSVNSGANMGPNLYLAGPSFNGNTISSPEEARERAVQQKKEGWDLLKIHPGLSLEEYNAMVETANDVGITFGGHVPADVGVIHAIKSGQITIDHVDGYVAYLSEFEDDEMEEKMDEVIQLTKENEVWIVPTMALWETIIGAADYEAMKQYDELKYIPKAVKQNYFNFADNPQTGYTIGDPQEQAELRTRILGEMNEAGVKILMGTDAPQLFSVPGFSIHRELPYMKAAGMTNYEILESGTKLVGEYFADWDDFGTIAAGQRADLILVDGNPLENLSAIQNHSGVMVQGKWYSREMIDEKLTEIEGYYND